MQEGNTLEFPEADGERVQGSAQYYEYLHILLPRYLRVRNPCELAETVKRLEMIVDKSLIYIIDWMPGFICIPGYVSLSTLKPIEMGFYPMDIASAIAVRQLFPTSDVGARDLSVLDMCCCPGSKYQMIADCMRVNSMEGTVVGVDICEKRMNVCKSLLKRWGQWGQLGQHSSAGGTEADGKVRQLLFLSDGTQFGRVVDGSLCLGQLVFDSAVIENETNKKRKRMNKSARMREKKQLIQVEKEFFEKSKKAKESEELNMSYDLIIVDAECSHDGSYRHMRYCDDNDHGDGAISELAIPCEVPFIKPNASIPYSSHDSKSALYDLQKRLICNGFRQLKVGGTMIYSTCSFEDEQNEDIVTYFLENHKSAVLIPCDLPAVDGIDSSEALADFGAASCKESLGMDVIGKNETDLITTLAPLPRDQLLLISNNICKHISGLRVPPCEPGKIQGTLRLSKNVGMSGLFIAKFTKISETL